MQARRYQLYLKIEQSTSERKYTWPPKAPEYKYEALASHFERIFFGKCAFCESRNPSDVYLFRPSSEAVLSKEAEPNDEDQHYYYSWLADVWENMYPICRECSPQRGDQRWFPVKGSRAPLPTAEEYKTFMEKKSGSWDTSRINEDTLLLDPCNESDPSSHIGWSSDGKPKGLTDQGRETIRHFKLDRPSLNKARRDQLTWLRSSDIMVNDVGQVSFEKIEFGGFLKAISAGNPVARQLKRSSASKNTRHRATPFISSIRINNFKPFRSLQIELGTHASSRNSRFAIIGENATGKTSVLEAIVCANVGRQYLEDLDLKPGLVQHDPSLNFQENAKRALPLRIKTKFVGGKHNTLIVKGKKFERCLTHETPVFAYGAFRQYLEDGSAAASGSSVESLFFSEKYLENPQDWLMSLQDNEFDMVVRALREIFEVSDEFDLLLRDTAGGECYLIKRYGNQEVAKVSIDRASSGFRSILAFLCDFMRRLMQDGNFSNLKAAEGILLVDEIEAHLHPKLKIGIVDRLSRAFPSLQIIVTTHDPLCLRGLNSDEIGVLSHVKDSKEDTGSRIELLQLRKDLAALTIEQLLVSDYFGLETTDDTVFSLDVARAVDELIGWEQSQSEKLDPVESMMIDLNLGDIEVEQILRSSLNEFLTKRRDVGGHKAIELREEIRKTVLDAFKDL